VLTDSTEAMCNRMQHVTGRHMWTNTEAIFAIQLEDKADVNGNALIDI